MTTPGTIARVNKALKRAGRDERLRRGRGYYYLHSGDAMSWFTSSIAVYWIDNDEAGYQFAIKCVNELLNDNDIKPIEV